MPATTTAYIPMLQPMSEQKDEGSSTSYLAYKHGVYKNVGFPSPRSDEKQEPDKITTYPEAELLDTC